MASPPIPPLLGHLAGRPFAFYPAILNVEPNQWFFRKATWSELVVVNGKTGAELSIPRRFVGELSSFDEPFPIVGLHRQLEYRDGAVWPYGRRVIEMPVAGERAAPNGLPHSVNPAEEAARPSGPAPVVGIRLESPRGSRTLKLVGGALAAAVFLGGVSLVRVGGMRQRVVAAKGHAVFELRAEDGYRSVVRKLGPPDGDRSLSQGGVEYRALGYSDLRFTVILRGGPADARYLGTMDANWQPIHSVPPAAGDSPLALLRALKRF
jgi:hypothetical protein